MADDLVLADTCVWIDYFNQPGGKVSRHLAGLIRHERVAVAGPVLAELYSGIKSQRELQLLIKTLEILPYYEANTEAWLDAAGIILQLKKLGKTVTLIDALIAALCIRNRLHLYSHDRAFDLIADHFPALVRHFPESKYPLLS